MILQRFPVLKVLSGLTTMALMLASSAPAWCDGVYEFAVPQPSDQHGGSYTQLGSDQGALGTDPNFINTSEGFGTTDVQGVNNNAYTIGSLMVPNLINGASSDGERQILENMANVLGSDAMTDNGYSSNPTRDFTNQVISYIKTLNANDPNAQQAFVDFMNYFANFTNIPTVMVAAEQDGLLGNQGYSGGGTPAAAPDGYSGPSSFGPLDLPSAPASPATPFTTPTTSGGGVYEFGVPQNNSSYGASTSPSFINTVGGFNATDAQNVNNNDYTIGSLIVPNLINGASSDGERQILENMANVLGSNAMNDNDHSSNPTRDFTNQVISYLATMPKNADGQQAFLDFMNYFANYTNIPTVMVAAEQDGLLPNN